MELLEGHHGHGRDGRERDDLSNNLRLPPSPLNGFCNDLVTSRPRDATLVSFPLVRDASPDPTVRESCVERVVAILLAYHTCHEDIASSIGTHPRLKVKQPPHARSEHQHAARLKCGLDIRRAQGPLCQRMSALM